MQPLGLMAKYLVSVSYQIVGVRERMGLVKIFDYEIYAAFTVAPGFKDLDVRTSNRLVT
jgi:hypothetical protein